MFSTFKKIIKNIILNDEKHNPSIDYDTSSQVTRHFKKIRLTDDFWKHMLHDEHKRLIQFYINQKPEERIFYQWQNVHKAQVMLHMPIRDILEFHFVTDNFQFIILINYEAEFVVLTNRRRDYNPKILQMDDKEKRNSKIMIFEEHVPFLVQDNVDVFSKDEEYAFLFRMNFEVA